MRHLTAILAASATFAAASAASAAGYLGMSTSLGIIRNANAVAQVTTDLDIRTNWVEIDYCSGFTEYLSFTALGLGRVQAVGSALTIRGKIIGAQTTEYTVFMHSPTDAVSEIRIRGSNNTKMGFDIKTAPSDTPGSLGGMNFLPVSMGGAWNLSVDFMDAVALFPNPPQGDLFASMKLHFTSCFKPGDKLVFRVDTDRVQ